MNYDDGMIFIKMGMSIGVGGTAVRRPASVTDTGGTFHRRATVGELFENLQPAHYFFHLDFFSIENGDSGGVIAPVF